MPVKIIKFNQEAKLGMKKGLDTVADAVKITLGPKGQNVAIGKNFGAPDIINDGVTIAREIMVEDEIEHLGAELIKEVATKTNRVAGDGTTTSVILTQAIITEGIKKTELGIPAVGIRSGMEKSLVAVKQWLNDNATKITTEEELINVASISANNKEIGIKVAEAVQAVGKEGNVSLTEGTKPGIFVNKVSGMQVDRGYLSPYMMKFREEYEKQEITLTDCPVIVTDYKVTSADLAFINKVCVDKYNASHCLVVCEDLNENALQDVIYNISQGGFRMVVIKAPGFGEGRDEECEDICAYTGAKYMSTKQDLSLNKLTVEHVGFVEKAMVKDFKTIMQNTKQNNILIERINTIKGRLENTDGEFNKNVLQDRITKMQGMIAEIEVAGISDAESKDLRLRVEDALNATKVAAIHGITAGGGTTLVRASNILPELVKDLDEDEKVGMGIIQKALLYPVKQLAINSGLSGDVVIDKVLSVDDKNYGFNAKDNSYGDLLEKGVIDPVFVTITALENAISSSMMFLVTGCAMETKINPKLKMNSNE